MNLYASGRISDILRSLPLPVAIATYIYERERISIYSEAVSNEKRLPEPIDLQPMIHAGMIRLASLSSDEELMSMYKLATVIQADGEAYTAALALHHHWAIGADDPSTVSLFRQHARQLPIFSTPAFIKHWAESLSPSFSEIAQALRNIQQRALYLPPSSHPLYEWWREYIERRK